MNIKNVHKYFVLMLLFQIINIIYWGGSKEGYFGDELYSYQFVCQTNYPSINSDRPDQSYLNNWHFSEYYQDYFTISDQEAFDFVGVYNSIKTDVHPPLYYMLLLISCSFFRKFTKWSMIVLNIICFALSDIILYGISRKLVKSNLGQLLPCLFWGFSVGAVTTAVFGRMYMLLTCITLLFIYLHILLIRDVVYNGTSNIKVFVGICVATILGTLTQYYFLIFAFFLSVCTWIFFTAYKKVNITIKYTITMFLGLLCSYVIWPTMYRQIFGGYRGDEAFENLKSSFELSYLRSFIVLISKEIFAGKLKILLICIFVLIMSCIFVHLFRVECLFFGIGRFQLVISKKKFLNVNIQIDEQVFIYFFILFATVMDIVMIAKIAPYRSNRYIFNIEASIILLFVIFGITLCEWISKSYTLKIFSMVVMIIVTLSGYSTTGVGYLYKGVNEKLEISNSYADLPVVLLTKNNSRFTSCNDALYFQNGQCVYPIDESGINEINDVLEEVRATAFILYVDKSYDSVDDQLEAVKNNVKADESRWIYSTNVSAVYLIER